MYKWTKLFFLDNCYEDEDNNNTRKKSIDRKNITQQHQDYNYQLLILLLN